MNWLLESTITENKNNIKKYNIPIDEEYELDKSYYCMLESANKEYLDIYKDILTKFKNSSLDINGVIKFVNREKNIILKKYISSWINYIFTEVVRKTINNLYTSEQKLQIIEKMYKKEERIYDLNIYVKEKIYYKFGYPPIDRIRSRILDSKDVLKVKEWEKGIKENDLLKNIDKKFLSGEEKYHEYIVLNSSKLLISNKSYTIKELLRKIREFKDETASDSKKIYKLLQEQSKELSKLKEDIKDTYKTCINIKGLDKDNCDESMYNIIKDYNKLFEAFCLYWKVYTKQVLLYTKYISEIINDMTDDAQKLYVDTAPTRKIKKPKIKINTIHEDKLKSSERKEFGIPELKKYPMPDKSHVLAAIRMFNHVDPKYERELANNIIRKMEEYNIPFDTVGDNNRLKKYILEKEKISK